MITGNSILLADDHSMIRMGLKLYLQFNLGMQDIHETASCNGLMRELVKRKYSHLVLDIVLSDGSSLEVMPNIKRVYPSLQVMIFSMQPAEIYAEAFKQYGINFYLSKTASEAEIIDTLDRFLRNEVETGPNTAARTLNPFSALAPRELEVLHYVLRGIGTKETSELLNLKMNTVSTIKNRIYEKTSAVNLKELLEMASLYNINY